MVLVGKVLHLKVSIAKKIEINTNKMKKTDSHSVVFSHFLEII